MENSSLFKEMFKNAYTGMVVLGRNSRLLFANRAFLSMSGLAESEVSENYFYDCLHFEDRKTFVEEYERLSRGDINHTVNEARKWNDDSQHWSIDLSLQRETYGEKQFVFGIISDVTEQKNVQHLLKSAKEAAEKSTRIKSDFLANMSHEIRTPIHTIIGMNELLLETSLDVEQQEYAEQVRFAADVLLSLINDILDFSKIEAGKLSLEKIEFDLYSMVEDALDLVSLEAHKKGLEVVLRIDPEVPVCAIGDPVRLRQIIVNLFNNAIKFTRKGEIEVRVDREEDLPGEMLLKFTVRDTGIGIPGSKLDKLFKAFSQIDDSTTRKYGGTGLGLSISQNLAGLMRGNIGVESEEGRGSAFWFTARLGRGEEESTFPPLPEEAVGRSVLVVDDNEASRQTEVSCLEEWDYDAEAVSNGPDALAVLRDAAARGKPFDACLIDLLMVKMDGWQLASEINADKDINSTKLLLMSPAGKSGDEAKMKLLHWFDGYLTKPLKKRSFYDTLARVFSTDVDLVPVEELELVGELEPAEEERCGVILIAEDHEVNQQLFKTILEGIGYDVMVAENGSVAVDMVKKHDFAVIFMDVQMPEKNGYEATREIRSLGVTTPIIAATASAVKEERDRCAEAGMDDLLIKPFKKQDILPLLDKWIGAVSDKSVQTATPFGASAEGNGDIFDYETAVETFMGKEDVVTRVLHSFIDKVEGQLPRIRDALERQDLESLRGEAHSIKGGSWNLEVRRLGDKAKELEDASREGEIETVKSLIPELEREYSDFLSYVEPYL